MQALLLWPEQPLLSWFVLWLGSVVFLWAARQPMARLLDHLGRFVGDGCQALAAWCREAAMPGHQGSSRARLERGAFPAQERLPDRFRSPR